MRYILIIFILLLPIQAKADWIDITPIIDWLKQMYGIQNDNLPGIKANTEATQKNTAATVEVLRANLSGHHGFGSLLNDSAALNERLWSNDSWKEVLNNVGGGNAEQLKRAQDAYAKLYPVASKDKIASNLPDNSLIKTHYEQTSNISRAALAASQVSYDSINKHIKNVHTILAKLESPEAETEKAAIDLNARLVAGLSFIQLDMLKMQSIQMQLNATETQAHVNGLSDQATFLNTK